MDKVKIISAVTMMLLYISVICNVVIMIQNNNIWYLKIMIAIMVLMLIIGITTIYIIKNDSNKK